MKTSLAFFCSLLIVGSTYADPYVMATQQAKRTSDANAAEQQRIQNATSAGSAASPAANAAPVNPALQATLNNIHSLQANFTALGSSTTATPDPSQRVSLLNNLSSAAQGPKASADSIKKLADDLLATLAGRKQLTANQQIRLARDIHALFNSSHLNDAQQKVMFDDVQKTLTDGGVSLNDAVNVVTDLKKVSSETK
jgi:hypothetical protein